MRLMAASSYKLVVVGSGGVGKSCITLRYVQDILVEGHDPTIEDSYQKFIEIDGNSIRLDILDTAGQEEFVAIRNQNIRQGQGFLIVYSITDRASFEKISELHTVILRTKGGGGDRVPIVILANKSDREVDRVVTKEEEKAFADKTGILFFPTSPVKNTGVNEAFNAIIEQVRQYACTPCVCMGKCECFDKCAVCGTTRNRHNKTDHDFKKKAGFCTIL